MVNDYVNLKRLDDRRQHLREKIFNGCRGDVNRIPDRITSIIINVNFKTNYLTKLSLGH